MKLVWGRLCWVSYPDRSEIYRTWNSLVRYKASHHQMLQQYSIAAAAGSAGFRTRFFCLGCRTEIRVAANPQSVVSGWFPFVSVKAGLVSVQDRSCARGERIYLMLSTPRAVCFQTSSDCMCQRGHNSFALVSRFGSQHIKTRGPPNSEAGWMWCTEQCGLHKITTVAAGFLMMW